MSFALPREISTHKYPLRNGKKRSVNQVFVKAILHGRFQGIMWKEFAVLKIYDMNNVINKK